MRVVSGKFRGRHFAVPPSFKARPTTDFAKENLFNVLRAYLDFEDTVAVDLFAGTGSVTLELLSRGCRRVVAVERERAHYAFIARCLKTVGATNAQALRADALRYIAQSPEAFDLVFADPPYALPELPGLPMRVFSSTLLLPGGLFVLEHGKDNDFASHPFFCERRTYGSVNFSFFRKPPSFEA